MSAAIVIIDTSVFVEILAVPGLAGAVDELQQELELWIEAGASLLPARRVLIWSLDQDLAGYDTGE